MTHEWTPEGTTPEPTPQPPTRKSWMRRHPVLTVLGAIAGGIVALIVLAVVMVGIGASTTTTSQGGNVTASTPTAQAEPSSSAPSLPAVADPKVQGHGSCDYILGDDPAGAFGSGTAKVIGEMDLRNSGNVGVTVHARMTWPQEGSAPISASKTVQMPFGAHKVIRFKVPINGDQVDLLQSWQERHGYNDGCKYHVNFGDTFGTVHS